MRFPRPAFFALGLTATLLVAGAARAQTPTDEEKKAIDLVAKLGGKAAIDPKLPVEARVSAKFDSATNAVLAGLKKAPHIGALDVYDATNCTEAGFATLKQLPHLRKLTLGKSALSAAGVSAIAQCKGLRVLYVPGAGVTDAELIGLKKLALLEALDISDNPQITDKGMAALKPLERLQILYLGKTGITDKGLMELKGLEGLRSLNVVGTKVSGEAADAFADSMPNLRAVRQ